jgi:hypothetical protein
MLAPVASINTTPLSTGTVFIHESVMLPASLKIETSLYSKDWRVVTTDQKSLGDRIDAAGWNFFFTVGKLEESALGALNPKTLGKAMRRILRQVQDLHFNAVEIGKIQTHSALGLVRYISISAHARHIQRSEQLENEQQRKTTQAQSAWAIG